MPYVKLQQAQEGRTDEPRPQLKVLEHEMGGTYSDEGGAWSSWRFPDGSKL